MATTTWTRARDRWGEGILEAAIALAGWGVILALGLVFAFMVREALPVVTDAALRTEVVPALWGGSWSPASDPARFGLWPLVVGTVKVTAIALAFSVPLAFGAALHTACQASSRMRAWMKPSIELLAGVPSVVVGVLALTFIASMVQTLTGAEMRLNALTAGLALAIPLLPLIYTLCDDALQSVPNDWREASAALGALPGETIRSVAVPAAAPGMLAAVLLGGGRALGETMIVMMATGNAPLATPSLLDSTRTLTATIAAEMGEVARGSGHYHALFLLGLILLAFTFATNLATGALLKRSRARLAGRS